MFRRKKGQKYNNKKVEFQGMTFDSKREFERYLVLMDAQKKGIISGLERQVKFELLPQITEEEVVHLKTKDKIVEKVVQQAVHYICDFKYVKDGKIVIEDVKIAKSLLPPEYILKEKMMRYLNGITIKRVYKPTELV